MDKHNERIVVYASTRNQYDKMETAAKSLLLNNVIDKVYFLTEDEEYPNELPSCIETINVEPIVENYFCKDGPNFDSMWTYMTLMRLTVFDLLKQHKRALYLDTDTLVMSDISDLFEMDLSDYYYAGVIDKNISILNIIVLRSNDQDAETTPYHLIPRIPYKYDANYYNAGVLVCNLTALRDGKGREMIQMVNTEPLFFKDQDTINLACRGKILTLPSIYNAGPSTQNTTSQKILHLSKAKIEYLQAIWKSYESMSWSWIEKQMAINRQKEEEARG